MKTTFDLPESLVRDIKRVARRQGTTARALVQQAMTRLVAEADQQPPFELADRSTTGWTSLNPEFRDVPLSELVHQSAERN